MPIDPITVRTEADQRLLDARVASGALVLNRDRRRPFYFDGRFLTANDLIADQDYVRARQSDLAQAMGAGVIRGLMVSIAADAGSQAPLLAIEPGSGITPAGELVSIASPVALRLGDIPASTELDAKLGVKLLPPAAVRNRSGLFVLALRPIEFSANPVPAYPTSLDGTRGVHDGDIVEATAVTLIPYPDRAGIEGADAKRARVARDVFLDGQRPGAVQEALPLAMLCLEGGALRWLDVFLVRREVGAESTLAAGLAQRPRVLLESWVKQYQDHLDDIDTAAMRSGFAATRYFEALPPVGPVPASALRFETELGRRTLLQSFFPPLAEVDFAFVPADELAVLVDEALALPPIDLLGADEDLDRLALLVVAPVSRLELEAHKRELQGVVRPVRPAASGLLAKRTPLQSLLAIGRPAPAAPSPADDELARAWQAALERARGAADEASGGRGTFWYLRKRQLPYTAEIGGATLRLAGDARALDEEVQRRLEADQRADAFGRLMSALPRIAQAEAVGLLAAPRLGLSAGATAPDKTLATSDLLRRSAFAALDRARAEAEAAGRPLDHAAVLGVAREFGDPRLGEGLDALRAAADEDSRTALATEQAVRTIEESGVASALDRAARLLPVAEQAKFGADLARAAASGQVEDVRKLAGGR